VPHLVNDWISEAFKGNVMSSKPIAVANYTTLPDQCGFGRLVELGFPITLEDAIGRVKSHLNLDYLRVARATGRVSGSLADIRTVAICAGSGTNTLISGSFYDFV
jgi:putative NIF3 family GTP cyclohydrolase 1 type 2